MDIRAWTSNLKCPNCGGDINVFRTREYFIDVDEVLKCTGCNEEIPQEILLTATEELTAAEKKKVSQNAKDDETNKPDADSEYDGPDVTPAKGEAYKAFKEQAKRIGPDAAEKIMDEVGIKGTARPTVTQAALFVEKAKPLKGANE